jgi:hypothetical protein
VIECTNCGRKNHESEKICVYCGAPLTVEHATTRSLDDTDYEEGRPHWGTARFNSRMCLIISERDSHNRHEFVFDDIHELIIGRVDPESGQVPDLDLTEYGAAERGVSRKHAVINRRDNALTISDQGSPNGTYLNGQRLVAHQPRMLRDGDEIRLGHLVLRITFARV